MGSNSGFGSNLMLNGWTGGQYSVFRVLLGAFLFAHFVQLMPWAWELFSAQVMIADQEQSLLLAALANILGLDHASGLLFAVTIAATAASLLFFAGVADKWGAFYLCFTLACLYGTDPLISKQGLTYLGWMLLGHLLMPKAPYGSLAALGRPDPGGGWRFPFPIYLLTLALLSMSYLYRGYVLGLPPGLVGSEFLDRLLVDPLSLEYFPHDFLGWLPAVAVEILVVTTMCLGYFFALLAYGFHRVRPWFWSAIFVVQFCIVFLLDFSDPAVTMLLFHLFAFDPGMIRSRKLPEHATLFYDGTCALCHRLVRFVLAEDTKLRITFSPLHNDYFKEAFTAEERIGLPHSSIMLKSDTGLIFEADAAIRILKMLGGLWLLLALVLSAFPRRWRNAGYHFVGDRRSRLFGRTETACPVVPAHLRFRFKE